MNNWNSGKVTFNGNLAFKHKEESYCAEVSATANWYHQPCVMYFKDGSGQPEYDEFEIDELTVTSLYNEDAQRDCFQDYTNDEVFKEAIEYDINDALYEMDSDKWSGGDDYDYEAEEEYYESLREREND